MKFCAAFCACCPPAAPLPRSEPPEAESLGSSVALTVRLLSGEPLLELSVSDRLRADELRLEVEAKAGARLAEEGSCVSKLLWAAQQLEGPRTLAELGVRGAQDIVAICARTIEGDFERFQPGCPTCDNDQTVTRMRFELSGVATLTVDSYQGEARRTFRYSLGEVEEGVRPGELRRSLCLERLPSEDESEAAREFEGWLEFDASDPIRRRVLVESLRVAPTAPWADERFEPLDLEDVRELQRRGADEAAMRVRMLLLAYQVDLDRRGDGLAEPAQQRRCEADHAGVDMDFFRQVFSRPRCQRKHLRRSQRPRPSHGRRSHCFCGLACQGRGSHWVCRKRGDVHAEAALARSRARGAARALKLAARGAELAVTTP